MASKSLYITILRIVVAAIVLILLIVVPAPLLPPHHLAETVQSTLHVNWQKAYLIAALGLQAAFWCPVGFLAAFGVKRYDKIKWRILQMIIVPLVIVIIALIIRSVKAGHPPIWINAAVPIAACISGVWLALGFMYRRAILIVFFAVIISAVTLWNLSGSHDAELTSATAKCLRRLVAEGSTIPKGEGRFFSFYKIAFAPLNKDSSNTSALQQNRAAILALGIALGDASLARFVGLSRSSKLMHQVALMRKGTTLRGRGDFVQHFSVSGALAVLDNPLVSDAGGLMKEQLDALAEGSGFSFGDVAADRAGVRFAIAATNTEEDAKAMQELIMERFTVSQILPPIDDLPMNLSLEQFRSDYGTVGSKAYRKKIDEIETRLDSCTALTPLHSGR